MFVYASPYLQLSARCFYVGSNREQLARATLLPTKTFIISIICTYSTANGAINNLFLMLVSCMFTSGTIFEGDLDCVRNCTWNLADISTKELLYSIWKCVLHLYHTLDLTRCHVLRDVTVGSMSHRVGFEIVDLFARHLYRHLCSTVP